MWLSLFAQVAPVTGTTGDFARQHSGVILSILGVVWALLLVTTGAILNWMRGELARLAQADGGIVTQIADVGRRVSTVESELAIYRERAIMMDKVLAGIAADVKELHEGFTEFALTNQREHADIIQSRHSMIERITRVEDKLPNGKLDLMMGRLDRLLFLMEKG